jgi:hypothetical protein
METDKIANLEKEVKQLSIKLETLVNYLNHFGQFGPPKGRDDYDAMVRRDLAGAGL